MVGLDPGAAREGVRPPLLGLPGAVKHQATKPKNAAITDSRPQIEIAFDEHIVVDEALVAIIKHDPALFQRGNALVIGASVAMDTVGQFRSGDQPRER